MRRKLHLFPVEDRVPYLAGLEWQRALARQRIDGSLRDDVVLLLEHEPVVTYGRGSDPDNLSVARRALEPSGIELCEVERGGDVTYHGPGQIVGYPIIDLGGYRKDLHWYLRTLEESLISALGALGVTAFRNSPHTGVWVGEPAGSLSAGTQRKIASIGVHVSRWVTWHGFALNVTNEPMRTFGLLVPCGIEGVHMTSLEAEGCPIAPPRVAQALAHGLSRAFGADVTTQAGVVLGQLLEISPDSGVAAS
ncbi:MAG: lipoyl(octanoyl) transferase LipB [Gemmatimonadota bacterium]